jgi:hypothetical protein
MSSTISDFRPQMLVSGKEAARLLSVGIKKVRREFKPVQTGPKQFRYRLRDLEQWIERRQKR